MITVILSNRLTEATEKIVNWSKTVISEIEKRLINYPSYHINFTSIAGNTDKTVVKVTIVA
jgi:hypothetical protein